MDFSRKWTTFALEAEHFAFGMQRICDAHNLDQQKAVEADRYKRERDALAEALQPFADFAEQWERKPLRQIDHNALYAIHVGTEYDAAISLHACLKARSLLSTLNVG